MPVRQKTLLDFWLALTLTVLFFHPLISTLHDNSIILQWRIQHTLELLTTVGLFTLFFFVILLLIDKISNPKLQLAILFLICVIPMTSFLIHFLAQLGFKARIITVGEYFVKSRYLLFTFVAFLSAIIFSVANRYPRKMQYATIIILLTLSPINLVAGWTVYNLRNLDTKIRKKAPDATNHASGLNQNIIIFLFDELSYEYLYKNNSIDPRYKNFYWLSTVSDNYHQAISPGNATLTAVPGMLMGKHYESVSMKYESLYHISKESEDQYLKIEPNNLLALAKRRGYKTFISGTYLPYCEMFDSSLDACQSFSIYNFATIEDRFSLLNPILTNLMIWPHQLPQGFLKNRAAAQWQKNQMEKTFQFTLRALDEKTPFLLFSHIFCTHVPFVFNKQGYYDNKAPYLRNSDNYIKSIEYADYLLGEFIKKMKETGKFETSEIVVLADHNYRIMFPGRESHIPLLIKKPNQLSRKDIFNPVNAENVLKGVLVSEATRLN